MKTGGQNRFSPWIPWVLGYITGWFRPIESEMTQRHDSMKAQMHKLEPRVNAAAWRNIICPTCGAGKNMNCVNVRKFAGRARKAHMSRILAARGVRKAARRSANKRPKRIRPSP